MGSSSSKSQGAQKLTALSDKAQLARKLSDDILNLFFSRADVQDILTLSSISACPRYIFTTAEALSTMFQSIQIEPKLGKKGEILFAPIQKLSPGLIKNTREGSQEILERTKIRNQLCIDVAYMYVRIFQIYAALSLTILDADPIRRQVMYRQPTKPGQGYAAPGYGMGGALSAASKLRTEMRETPGAPLADLFTSSKTTPTTLIMDDMKASSSFKIGWVKPARRMNTIKLVGLYSRVKENKRVDVKMVKEDETIIMYIDDTEIATFVADDFGDSWTLEDDESFPQKIHDYFDDGMNRPKAAARSSGITTGKSSFENFDKLKKLFDARHEGKPFPKAYCIARAMTLMNPIFEGEKTFRDQPYIAQICSKTLDFETSSAEMPMGGKQPKANIYFQSIVSLHYDNYEIRGGDILFTQSEAARQELAQISSTFASLYNVTTSPEKFLESSTPIKKFVGLCDTENIRYVYKNDALRKDMFEKVVNPMIKFQEDYTKRVNDFFGKMFVINGTNISFSPKLKSGGRQSVNYFSAAATSLLREYYSKSEAYYLSGIRLLTNNKNFLGVI